jgi:hypothetical protein
MYIINGIGKPTNRSSEKSLCPIILVEGEKCANKLWTLRIATAAIFGGSKGYDLRPRTKKGVQDD